MYVFEIRVAQCLCWKARVAQCFILEIKSRGLHTAQWYEFEIKGYTAVLCYTFEIRKKLENSNFLKILTFSTPEKLLKKKICYISLN